MKAFLKARWPLLLDLYIFLNVALWVAWRLHHSWAGGTLGSVEIAFAVQNVIFLAVILARRAHRAIDRNPVHQAVALVAFFSGLAFMGQAPTGGETALAVSKSVTVAALVFSSVCLATLGRSFGILIALRTVQTRGVYGIVRHPMYAADILLRVGYLIGHFNALTSTLFILSAACYVYRALLEERFLRQSPEYRDYMKTVRYRFIPFLF